MSEQEKLPSSAGETETIRESPHQNLTTPFEATLPGGTMKKTLTTPTLLIAGSALAGGAVTPITTPATASAPVTTDGS